MPCGNYFDGYSCRVVGYMMYDVTSTVRRFVRVRVRVNMHAMLQLLRRHGCFAVEQETNDDTEKEQIAAGCTRMAAVVVDAPRREGGGSRSRGRHEKPARR